MRKIRIKIPATTANFGSGFDVLGAALKLYNFVEITGDSGNIEISGEGKNVLPRDKRNVVVQAMNSVFDICKTHPQRFGLRLINNIPLARGLGSSAAARLGGIVAANELCGGKLSEDKVIQLVSQLEGHPDNVVPSFFGGLCVCNFNGKGVKYTKMKMPSDLKAVLCIPDFQLKTSKSRNVLPEWVSHDDAIFNSSRVALFIMAIAQRKYSLLSLAMDDRLHQPYRKKLIPGMCDVFSAASKAGAYGACISGSGPTILALSDRRSGEKIGKSMQKAFLNRNIKSKCVVCDFDNTGILKNLSRAS